MSGYIFPYEFKVGYFFVSLVHFDFRWFEYMVVAAVSGLGLTAVLDDGRTKELMFIKFIRLVALLFPLLCFR